MLNVPGEDVVGADDYQAQMRFVVNELLYGLIILIMVDAEQLFQTHTTSLRGTHSKDGIYNL